jgi:LemA protein
MKKFGIGCGILVVLLAAIILIGGCSGYNNLVKGSQNVDSKWAQVQNQYQRRFDLIPNLVNTVSGAANFEKSTITEVTEARSRVGQVNINPNQAPADPAQLEKFEQAQGQLGSALSRLLVVAERYPELKATQNFAGLQAELAGTENRIAVERMRFNEAVQSYNTSVQSLPTRLYAGLMGFHPKPYFKGATGSEAPPKVEFDFNKK